MRPGRDYDHGRLRRRLAATERGCAACSPSPPRPPRLPRPPHRPPLLLLSTVHAMSSAGLSRRRVPASASTGDDDADGINGPSASNGGSVSRSDSLTSPSYHAGSAFEGGSKIAFDPRDLERDDEDARLGGKPPRLTIMEEVLLLGLKDKQVRICLIFNCSPPSESVMCLKYTGTSYYPSVPLVSVPTSTVPATSLLAHSCVFASPICNGQPKLTAFRRDICHFGTTTSPTPFVAAS